MEVALVYQLLINWLKDLIYNFKKKQFL